MPYPPRTALDLLSLKDSLPKEQRRLKGLIERLASANSIKTDLQIASEMMDSLEKALKDAEVSSEEGVRSWQGNAALALINSAIILYARATKTSSKHRRNLSFLEHFSDEQKVAHTHLCSLRDDAIAHYGPGATLEGQTWHTEAIFMPLDIRDDLRILTASRRLLKQRQLQDLAKTQIHTALEIAEVETKARNSAVVAELNALSAHSDFMESTVQHHIDLAAFFLSEEEADKVLSNRSGKRSGVINH
jgi:hypothetical protein